MLNAAASGWKRTGCLSALVCLVACAAPAARSQQASDASAQGQSIQNAEPIPAYRSPLIPSPTNSEEADTGQQGYQPDLRPLSGAQYISMGNLSTSRSYWQPRLDLSGTADSNPEESTSNTSWGGWGSFLAGVDVHHTSGTSDMMLSYTGGGMYSDSSSMPSGAIQELGFTQSISFRRAVLSFFDQLDYLPQASLGFGGVGGLPLSGGGSSGLGSGFTTGQSILTGEGQNLGNSSVVQLQTFLTPRSSITMTGGYSVLHFFGSNLIDSGDVILQGGYNYRITQHNTVALLYSFNQFRYKNFDQSIDAHTAQASFGRQITGRLAFQIAAGPEFAIFEQASGNTVGTVGTAGASNTPSHIYWSLNSALNYEYERTALGLTYSHGIAAGSGVLAGSLSDIVTGTVSRRMSRAFSSGISAGYARNSALPIAFGPTAAFGQNYDYWFAGANLARPFSQTVALTFSYQVQYQNSNTTFCIGPSCGTSILRNLVTVGLSWHQRPLVF